MDDVFFKKGLTVVIILGLAVLAFLMLRPILLAIIFGILLAFIFTPLHNRILKLLKAPKITAILVCILLIWLVVLPVWFLLPIIINQSVKLYIASQQLDFVTPLRKIFPALFASNDLAAQIGPMIHTFVTNTTNSIMNGFADLLLQFPTIMLQTAVVFFTLFFVLKDRERIINYIQSLLPFTSDVQKRMFKLSKDITSSVLIGQIVLGMMQGAILGAGLFIFKVPNALLLTIFSVIAGVLPIVGPALVWIPTAVFLFAGDNTFAGVGIIIFGLISSFSDSLVRPFFVSRKAELSPAVVLIGMIGGFMMFGVLGFIIGPLILAYLIIILDVYRKKPA
ncbi:MAG: AI-2E family transporter [Nanoarchaeota archaeon]|nr:AI-2E family transporter [Nanoarchaeota archaeon]